MIYIVKQPIGSYDDYYEITLGVFDDPNLMQDEIDKYLDKQATNRNKVKNHYLYQLYTDDIDMTPEEYELLHKLEADYPYYEDVSEIKIEEFELNKQLCD